MAHIRKRILPSGKVRFQVIWEAKGKRVSEMFDTFRDATGKRIAVEASKPGSSAKFSAMAADYIEYMQELVTAGDRERSYIAMLQGHINNHILPDKEFSQTRCCSIGTPEVQLFLNRLVQKIPAKRAGKVRTTLSQIFKYGSTGGLRRIEPGARYPKSSASAGRRRARTSRSCCRARMRCAPWSKAPGRSTIPAAPAPWCMC